MERRVAERTAELERANVVLRSEIAERQWAALLKVELVQPTDDTTGVARYLAKEGEGFHHVCFEVANLAEELTRLGIDGVELIDTAPRRGAEGPVAFLHPRSCHGVLVELIEAVGGPAWKALGYPD